MEEHFLVPMEVALLVAIWLLPPVVISIVIHTKVFLFYGTFVTNKVLSIVSVVFMVVISGVSTVVLYITGSDFIPYWLMHSESMLFLPLSFIVVFIASIFTMSGVVFFANQTRT